jgi:hypothetical protein
MVKHVDVKMVKMISAFFLWAIRGQMNRIH